MTKDEILEMAMPVNLEAMVGVYFLLDGDEIVYVGQSKSNIPARIQAHAKDKEFQKFTVMPCDPDMLDDLEAKYIAQYAPKYNRTLRNSRIAKDINIETVSKNCRGIVEVCAIGGRIYILLDTISLDDK